MKTNFLGMSLNNPIIVAAGPWSRDGEGIRRSLAAGAGAVVTETIVSDPSLDVRPRIAYDGLGAQNIRLYSDVQIEGWEREMDIAKSGGGIVIANVSAHTPSELAYLAVKMEKYGADGIELGLSSPMGEGIEVATSDPSEVYEMTRYVVENVKIPVMVKLSQNVTNLSKVAQEVQRAGGSAVSAINAIRCILGVNINTMEPMLPTYGGYSGRPIKPLGLASVASIAQTVDIPICGIGGIDSFENALEYIMLGASAIQIGTSLMLNGRDRISKIIEDLDRWGEKNNVYDVKEIRGKALGKLKSFEEIKIEPLVCHVDNGINCPKDCQACMDACVYGALSMDEKGNIYCEEKYCGGCGLCLFVCPVKKLKLDW
jgi:dihydroorotate dehydrogenase subfamily 1